MNSAPDRLQNSRRIPECFRLTASILLVFLLACHPVLADDTGPADPAEIEAFFDAAVPAGLAKYNIPGAVVSVVKDGELVFSKGYGYSDIANNTEPDPETTLFHIGSITKLFTWTCVMQLVEDGRIDLDEDVNTYLTDFSIPDTWPGQPVTMRHLMTHSAGFEEEEVHFAVASADELYSFRTYCAENIPARVYPPGTVTSYSNYGTTLAGVAIEDVTGTPYEQYLDEHIFSPLGMEHTTIPYWLPSEAGLDTSSGYHYEGGANVAVPDTVFVIGPAGTIASTADDMAKFLSVHLEGGAWQGAAILSPDTAALMHAPAFSNDPRVSAMCLGFYEMRLNGERIIGHGGDTDTFHSYLILLPERNTGFFVSYNSPGGNQARDELLTAFVDHYYPAGTQAEPVAETGAAVGKYAGTYQSTRHNYAAFEFFLSPPGQVVVSDGGAGTLLLAREGKAPSEYVEVETGVFAPVVPGFTGKMVFREDESGKVDFLCLENVPVFAFERVPWYATYPVADWVKRAGILILLTVLAWPLMAVFRRVYGVNSDDENDRPFYARMVAGLAAITYLVFALFLLPAAVGDEALMTAYTMERTAPLMLSAIMTLPVVGVVLTVVAALFLIPVWKRQYWNRWHRAHYTLVVIGLFLMTWWTNHWNLFVFRM